MINLSNNELIIYSIATVTVILVTSLLIHTYLVTTTMETPDSPPTFNFAPKDLKELDQMMDTGAELSEEIKDKLEEDFSNILGKEEFSNFKQEQQTKIY
jgi:hypothetical protein